MNTRKYLTTAAVVALAIGSAAPVFAAETAKTATAPAVRTQPVKTAHQQKMETSAKMLSQVSLAAFSLDFDLPEDAKMHIKTARKIAMDLKNTAPELITSEEFKLGTETYKYKSDIKDFYVPVIDDVFVTRDYDVVMGHRKNAEVDERDAVIKRYKLSLNLQDVVAALDEADKKIGEDNLEGASIALDGVFKDALVSETVVTNPLWAVHDNLAATYNLLQNKNYDGAKFALSHTAKSLKAYEKETGLTPERSKAVKLMSQEISTLQDALKRDDPNIIQKAEMKAAGWLHEVKSWYQHRKTPTSPAKKN